MKAIILGTGASALKFENERGQFVIGCNDAIKLGKELDAIAFPDTWQRVKTTRPKILETPDHVIKFNKHNDCPLPNSRHVPCIAHKMNGSFNFDKLPLNHGCTSAFYAAAIAIHWGHTKIEVHGVDIITHEHIGEKMRLQKLPIEKMKPLSHFGGDIKEWARAYGLHNSIIEFRLLKNWLASKGGYLKFSKHSPIEKLINYD